MRKILIMIPLTLILTIAAAIPAMAAEYEIGGVDPGMFGKPTSVEPATVVGGGIGESSNVNRSKDSAVIPPSFGSPGSNTPGTGESLTPNISGMPMGYGNDYGEAVIVGGDGGTVYYPASPAALSEVDSALRTAGTQVPGWDNGLGLTDPIRHMVTDTVFLPDARLLSRSQTIPHWTGEWGIGPQASIGQAYGRVRQCEGNRICW